MPPQFENNISPANEPVLLESPRKHTRLVCLTIVMILVGVLAIAFFWYHNKQAPVSSIENQSLTSSSSADQLAEWKTYTNTKYGISIEYPPYNTELKGLSENINVELLDNKEPEDGPNAFWIGVSQDIWRERYEKRESYKIGDECANNEQEMCKVYSLNPFVLKILENYAEPYPDPYKLVFPTDTFQLTVGPLPHSVTDEELDKIISTFKFTE